MIETTRLSAWAAQAGLKLQLVTDGEHCVDFGRWRVATPSFVLEPQDEAQLAEAMRFLLAEGVQYKFRGAGHSSGGQVLIEDGAIIDLRALCRVLHDDPEREEITVEGGMTWLTLIDHLAAQGRRPLCLTTGFYATVAGTIAVGGFGDTTHLYGLVTAGVIGLTVITPDGARHVVGPGDPLFDYSLAGQGQLGALASVTLKTLRRASEVRIKSMSWPSLADLVRDSLIIHQLRLFEFLRTRLFYSEGSWVAQGIIGHFSARDATPPLDVSIDPLRPCAVSEIDSMHQRSYLQDEPGERSGYACPAVEFSLPLPQAIEIWSQLIKPIESAGLLRYLQHGVAVTLVTRQAAPLAPVPDAEFSILLALRPLVPPDEVASVIPHMRELAARALAAGARLYMMSIEPDQSLVRAQFGAAFSKWAELKQTVDPAGLCNPGLHDR